MTATDYDDNDKLGNTLKASVPEGTVLCDLQFDGYGSWLVEYEGVQGWIWASNAFVIGTQTPTVQAHTITIEPTVQPHTITAIEPTRSGGGQITVGSPTP